MVGYDIADTNLAVSGSPPGQTLSLDATVEVTDPGTEDLLQGRMGVVVFAGGGQFNTSSIGLNISEVSLSKADGTYPGSKTVTFADGLPVGTFNASRPAAQSLAQARRGVANGSASIATGIAVAYADKTGTPVRSLPDTLGVPVGVFFNPSDETLDTAFAEAGTVEIQRGSADRQPGGGGGQGGLSPVVIGLGILGAGAAVVALSQRDG